MPDKRIRPAQRIEPPVIAQLIFGLFPEWSSFAGDLTEVYETEIVPRIGFRKARLWYWKETAHFAGLVAINRVKWVITRPTLVLRKIFFE